MEGREVYRLLARLLLILSLATVNASKVLDEVPIPVDSELDLSHQRYPAGSDDEDFGWSAEGSTDIEEGSTTDIPNGEILTTPDKKTVYYRVLVNFTNSIEYNPQLEDFESEAFREISEGIIDTLESEFYRISGEQSVTVVLIREVDHNVVVELDVGSDGNSNDAEIREVVNSAVRSGSIGPYETTVEGFLFRHLGQAVDPSIRPCHADEFTCGSGECITLNFRCDFRADCNDMSDEDDCADLFSTVAAPPPPPPPPPTIQPTEAEAEAEATTIAFVTARPIGRKSQPLVTAAPTPAGSKALRPCPVDKAVCQNGQCIPRDYLCDGERDCTDGSDELDCGTPSPCEPNEFKCKNGRCALKLWRCDGDNDCGDGSDEEYCPTKGPGDMCAPEQFVCVSNRLCIPASYQCDEEADCPDRSDEFGCTPPQVVTPPEETVMVKRGATVVLNCMAAGVPTPIITWRLNWGHIPITSRVTTTSQNGRGTLVIRDVKESDQGAYTCEAINAKGMIFAIPDAILILKSNPGLCPEGQFNVEGTLRCIPCFCLGLTRNCVPTSRYRNQIRLRFTEEGNFMGVNVTVPAPAQPPLPPLTNSQMIVDTDSGEFQLVDLSRRFLNQESFWILPKQFLGNKVDSYGGYLRYKIRYSVPRGQVQPEGKLDVIITGNGRKLVYKVKRPAYSNVINQRDIIFTEDKWQHESGTSVTREDLMMTLANLDSILIQTKYDDRMASVGLSDIVMDTTSVEATNLGKPLVVEECRCPQSYVGLSCESCASGFNRVPNGQYLGMCDGCSCNGHASTCDKVTGYCLNCQHNTEGPQCDKCKPGFFGNPTEGTSGDCKPCPCPHTSSSRRFSDTCFVDTDKRPTCDACRKGYTGRRCETCAAGYTGDPMRPGGKCTATAGEITTCDTKGTDTTKPSDGHCVCKPNVVGRFCAECSAGFFNLDDANVDGCLKCFCMGNSKECASSSWHRDQVQGALDEQERSLYMLTNMADTRRFNKGIRISASNELIFTDFATVPRDIYYWILPERFKGDKVTSYGGKLQYTILQKSSLGSSAVTGLPAVILQGNNIFLEHYTRRPEHGVPTTITVHLKETEWRRADGQPSTRGHLLMALADINLFMIRGSYSERATESRISQIRMDVAVPHSTGQEIAVEVEECVCPEGYKGTSCQECDFGYTRTRGGLYLGTCERCECNGHSDCDVDTGECQKCQHNTQGQKCEQCRLGFYGDAKGGTPDDCQPCSCPGTTPSNQFSETCFLGTDGKPTCNNCPSGFGGRNCERCAPGYTGNPIYGQRCTIAGRCTCDWRGSIETQCDASGNCRCKPHVEGPTCDTCKRGHFFLSTENRDGCVPCFCMGVTQQCSSSPYYRKLVASPFVPPNNFQNFSLVSRQRTTHITSGFTVTVRQAQPQLSFGRFGQYTQESYYWQLPEVFQGDKVTSYGGRLRYTLSYDSGFRGTTVPDADVQIIGNDITLVTYHTHQLQPRETMSFEVMFKEQLWKRPDGQPATRQHLLMVLADLDEVLIRATYSTDMISASLSDVSMEIAVPFYTDLGQALEVEECHCPLGYHGLSCQDCAPGYTRTSGGLYLGHCERCECNGHSDACHPESGACSNCLHNSAGEFCDHCAPGYYGDATTGSPEDCQPCACPLPIAENQFSPICENDGVGGFRCTACLLGYTGQHCEYCAPGYSGNPRIPGQRCLLVDRNPFVVRVIPERAEVEQGGRVILKCQVIGQAPFYYYWSRADGQALSSRVQQRAQGEELVIQEVKPSDAGIYICTCRNMESSNSSQVEVFVTATPFKAITVTVEEPKTQTVRPGITVNFICTAKSQSPAYTLVWTRQHGSKLPNTAVDFNGILTIRNVRPEDAGTYICTGSNMFDMDEGAAVLTIPASAPVATIEPQILTVKQGQTAEFRCTVAGNPPPILEWFGGQGNIISPNAVIQDGLLRIVATEHSDEAEYSCKASNSAGHHIATTVLYVQNVGNLPRVQVSPQRIEVPEGDTVRLYCRAGGHPTPTLTWKKRGGELPPQAVSLFGFLPMRTVGSAKNLERRIQELQAKIERTDIGTLVIPSITSAHSGVYLCVGTNAAGSSEGRIDVMVFASQGSVPVVRIHPSPAKVRDGETLELYCQATGDPQPVITWRRARGRLTSNHQVQGPLLRIRPASRAEAGDYVCHAENSLGMQDAAVSVSITSAVSPRRAAPTINVYSSPSTVTEGEPLVLHCQVTGHPQPRVTWHRTGGPLTANHQVHGPVLRILHMMPSDIGDYICRAENIVAMREVKFSVSVTTSPSQRSPPTVLVHPSPTSVTEGETVELHCQVTGHPQPRITWYRSAGPLTTNHQVDGPVLRILQVTAADAGDYVCRAENVLGMQEIKFSVLITSISQSRPPTVLVHPSPTSVTEGEAVELHCQVTGQPQPRITWYRTDGRLTTNHQVDGSVLRILRVSPADVGDYVCRADNALGMQEIQFSVFITTISQSRPPTVLVHPSPTSVTEGETVELHCQVTGQPQPRITWYRTAEPLTTNHQVDGSVLRILRVTSADVGDFICRAENVLGMQEIRFSVLITSISQSRPPTVLVHPSPTSVTEGETVELHCQVTGQPQPRITWYRSAGPLTTNHQVDGSVLRILRVTSADVGDFICRAENVLGMQEIRFSVLITSISQSRPPTVLVHPSPTSVTEGETVELHCQVTGQPQPRITWYRSAGPLTTNHQVDGSVLRILRVTSADVGDFICRANNALGMQEIRFSVLITTISQSRPPTVLVHPSPTSVTEGETAELHCQVTGQPQPRITWYRTDGRLTTNHQVDGSVLRILRVTSADVGDFICHAENVLGMQEIRFSVLITPISQGRPPTVLVHPSPTSVTEGETVELHCQVTGQPQPRITWYRSAGALTTNHQVDGSVLRILRVTSADVGDFICRAENVLGMQEIRFSVLITTISGSRPPTVLVHPSPTSVTVGEMVELHCQVTGQPQPRITWYRTAGPLTTNHQVDGSVLRIHHVTSADSGDYVCRAENALGMQEIKFSVLITAITTQHGTPPKVRVYSSPSSVTDGEMLELHCQASGQPEPKITWSRAAGPLTTNHQVDGPVLRILRLSPADAGEYICRAKNVLGMQEVMFSVSIASTAPTNEGMPIVRVQPTPTSVTEGDMLELHCQITGHPQPFFRWYKLSGTLTERHEMQGSLLRILEVTPADMGDYICRAENKYGMEQLIFSVSVTSMSSRKKLPVITTGSQDVTEIEGGDVVFQCQVAEGAQPFHIVWKTPHQDQQDNVKISSDGTMITITRIHQQDQGQYKCIARNQFGSAFTIMTLIVQGPPTVSISPRGPVRLGLGDSITLECIGMGEPRPTISWHRSGGRPTNNVGRQLPKEGEPILTISSARLQDSGTYSCRSRNMFGTAEAQVEVIVDRSPSTPQAPQVTAEEPSITTTAGQTATLRCSATGYPTPIIQWSKLRAPLPWQHKIVDGSLVIPNVGLQDSGQFICNASNSAGFNELFIMLDVETTPYATFDVETISVRVGEIVRLHCLSQGTPPITYVWSKVNGTMPDRAINRNGILQINLAVVSDSGRYKCLVKNKVGQSDAIATVNVKSPPAARISPQIEVKNIGATVEFTCTVIGHPKPRIEWMKEGGQLPPNHRVSKGVLRIQNIQEGNEGVYICRAVNQFGQAQDSGKLVIQALPIVMINVRTSMQMVMVGGSVEFECQAIGDPQPFVKWSKVESALPPDVIIRNGMLKFEHVKESDAGRYRCTATNEVGSVQSEVVLYVQTVPMIAPHPELKEVAIGSTAVFPCLASGFPVPEVTWSKLEGELPPGANVENNVLTIPSAAPKHTGTYVCTATNDQGTETAYAMLKVRERKVPYFTQSPISYIAVPTIKDAYHEFEIKITFRSDAADGMIIYNGQRKNTGADFISFSLVGGRPEFRFDVGSGMATIRHPNPISLGEYHTVVLYRNLTQGSLYVDTNPPVNGSSQGSFRGLDLNEELYIGGYPNFDNISKVTGSNSGFMGCIRQLIIQGDEVIFSAPDLKAKGISNCPVCKDNPCKNGGQCVDSETSSYVCRCRSGFTGSNCEHSQAWHCHPEACGPDATCVNIADGLGYNCRCHLGKSGPKCMDGVLITAPSFRGGDSFVTYPPLTNVHNELSIELEFKPRAPTGLMFYSSGKRMKMNDFISVSMLNGHVEFHYELGSGLAVLRSAKTVALNKWHKLRAHRHDRAGSLTVDNEEEIRNVSPGKSLGLNLRSPMYLGGVARSEVLPKAINITEGIDGCIAKVLINGKKVDISYTFLESQNVDQCYDNSPCDRVPCLHGGRCLMTGEYEYQCICTSDYQGEHCEISQDKCLQGNPCMNGGTCEKGQCLCPMGYTGSYCELGMPAPAPEWLMEGSADSPVQYGAFFHSGGHIILPKQMFPRSSPSAPETIEMEVRTSTRDGLLLWQGVKHGESGKGKDYVALGLQNGHVLFSYQLGSGEANILSDDPINDGEWHKIIAVREGKSGYVQLDGDEIVRGESKGDKVMVNTGGSIYLGGAPEVKYFTGGKFTSGITGCIRKVTLVNKRPGQHRVQPVDLQVHAEGGVNAEECQS
ncbi:basement membrane-specific heparan sulfate proteoglycan core protein [Rhinoraja longicauda]